MFENTKLNHTDRVIIALALIALVFSFTSRFDFTYTRLLGGIWNFGHVVAFYIWTYLCIRFIKPIRSASFLTQFIVLISIALLFGVFIEFLQMQIGRDADIGDVISDLSGASLATFIHSNKKTSFISLLVIPFIIINICAILIHHKKIVLYPINDYYTYQNFPVLIEPTLPFESTKFKLKKIKLFEKVEQDSKTYFKVVFSKADYSTLFMGFFPVDWQGFDELHINVFNPMDRSFDLVCRIHDLPHLDNKHDYKDRFGRKLEIKPGNNLIKIAIEDIENAPSQRKMDLTKLAAIGLFTAEAEELNELHIYGAELIKR